MTYTVIAGQTLLDVVLMVSGTLEAADAIAAANDLALSDDVTAGQELVIPFIYVADVGVLAAIAKDGLLFGTAETPSGG